MRGSRRPPTALMIRQIPRLCIEALQLSSQFLLIRHQKLAQFEKRELHACLSAIG